MLCFDSDFAYGEEDHIVLVIKSVEKSLGIRHRSTLLEIEYIVESDLREPHHTIFREDETRSNQEEEIRECDILHLSLHLIELFESLE